MIRAYSNSIFPMEAIKLYNVMCQRAVRTDHLTYPFLLRACGRVGYLVVRAVVDLTVEENPPTFIPGYGSWVAEWYRIIPGYGSWVDIGWLQSSWRSRDLRAWGSTESWGLSSVVECLYFIESSEDGMICRVWRGGSRSGNWFPEPEGLGLVELKVNNENTPGLEAGEGLNLRDCY